MKMEMNGNSAQAGSREGKERNDKSKDSQLTDKIRKYIQEKEQMEERKKWKVQGRRKIGRRRKDGLFMDVYFPNTKISILGWPLIFQDAFDDFFCFFDCCFGEKGKLVEFEVFF